MPNPVDSGLPNPAAYDTRKTGVVLDKLTRLMWQRTDVQHYKFDEVPGACDDVSAAGYGDWRVPTRLELVTLIDFTAGEPAIDEEAFPATASIAYWSMTPYPHPQMPDEKWVTSFQFGGSFIGWPGPNGLSELPVRCVRGAAFSPVYQLGTDALTGTVLDTTTGLRWQQTAINCGAYEKGASEACEALVLAGFDDWRVPSMKELQLLIDDTHIAPAVDQVLFPPDISLLMTMRRVFGALHSRSRTACATGRCFVRVVSYSLAQARWSAASDPRERERNVNVPGGP